MDSQAAERRARFLVIGGMTLWGRRVRVESSGEFASVTFRIPYVVYGQMFVYSQDLGLSEFGETSSLLIKRPFNERGVWATVLHLRSEKRAQG
jgi:hypothetical protein